MSRRTGLIIVMCTVLLVHLLFFTRTYHISEIKLFVFTAGTFLLSGVVAAEALFGRISLAEVFRGRAQKRVFAALLAYLLLSAASVVWARYGVAALVRTLEILLYATWALLVSVTLANRRQVSALVSLFLVAGVLTAATGFVFHFLPVKPAGDLAEAVRTHREQFYLPMGNPNFLAACLLIPAMLCVEGFVRNLSASWKGMRRAAAFAGSFLLMAAAAVLAASESAGVAFLFALVTLPVFLRVRRRWLVSGVVLGVIALVCVLDLTFGRPGKIRTFAQSKSVVIRLDTWGWGLKLAGRSPVVGLGAGGFLPNVSEVSARDMTRKPGFYSDVVVNVHNEPLEIVVELGVLGLLAFLWPIGVLLWGVARLPRDDDDADPLRARVAAFAVGWLALFLHSFLDVGMRFWSVPAVFFTGIGLLSASLRVLGRPEDESATGADAAPRPRTRGAAAYLVMLFLTLLAGACFVICRGFRASLAMQQALHVRDDDTRIGLLTRAADDSVFFIDRVRARKELGRALHEAGKPAAAGDQFKTVIRLAGHFHDTELRLASALFDRDRPEEAMTCIESYARLRPADARTADLIVRYLRRQPPDSVIKVLNEKFLVAHPECSKVHVAAGKIGLMMAPPRTEEARAYFELALETNPADAHAAFLLGLERHKENRLSDAHSLLTASLKLGLRLPELYLELARMERMSGEEERSRRLLREGLDLFPDSPELRKEAETVREART